MCIIIGNVESVKGTKIFAMPSSDDSQRQLLVYKNEVASVAQNLMILPVPFPETLKFEKVSKTLFRDLEDSICWTSREWKTSISLTRSTLPVLSVGSYRVSVVPSIQEFSNLDNRVFSLPAPLVKLMTDEYGDKPFGFVCCRLKAGVQNYEPLAYSHRRWKSDMLFIPTLHYHPGEEGVSADWDHEVYTMRTTMDANQCHGWPAPQNRLRRLPEGFEVWPLEHVHCWMKTGTWKNIDLELPLIS
jgi:hypothetical protein